MALLNLTNFDDHPTDPTWMVFRFGDREMAREFIAGLEAAGIPFEAEDEEDVDAGAVRLIGVKQRFRDAAVRVNYVVLGRHREPFLSNALLRWVLLAFVGLLVGLATLGWLRS
jgi:hypothetical protein